MGLRLTLLQCLPCKKSIFAYRQSIVIRVHTYFAYIGLYLPCLSGVTGANADFLMLIVQSELKIRAHKKNEEQNGG